MGERGGEQVAAAHHPQDRAAGRQAARSKASRKQGRGRIVGKAAANPGEFVKRVGSEAAVGQSSIHVGNPECKAPVIALRGRRLDRTDSRTHRLKL